MKWIALVVLAGALAAAPFLSSRALGTTEAYNYSLSVADAVTQFRAGVFPVLAGQTEYAFNGRVHPLRTAPLMDYAAGALDILTFRQLGFWSLQNLTLALSLIGGALACYWGLSRVTPATPATAAVLSALYILSPPVLAAAYGMDLYMTVMTVPFVPLILAASVASFDGRRREFLFLHVTALAACWLAHPPIAFWMSVLSVLLQGIALGLRPPGRADWLGLVGAAGLFVVLAGFAFASALTISPEQTINQAHDPSALLTEVGRTFRSSLQPVSPHADQLGDFQLGYVGWGLAALALALAAWRRHRAALALLLGAAVLLVLTSPVPGLTRWLWQHAPGAAFNLTNQWPMQRLYLPMTMLVLLAFALVWRPPVIRWSLGRDALRLILAGALGWSAWQGWHFIARGLANRHSAQWTERHHDLANLDLTQISYALVATPGDFVHGVIDPAFNFRLLRPGDLRELTTNWQAQFAPTDETRRGVLAGTDLREDGLMELSPALVLQPGRRYRLTLDYRVPAFQAMLQIRGATMEREYSLPSAGGPRGFGMAPGNNRGLTLWTTGSQPEKITLGLVFGPGDADGAGLRGRPIADFTFERIDPAALPVELRALLPLRARVTAPEAAYLETPRMFIPGYAAAVNGRPVRPQASPEGMLMLPVPAGESQIEVSFPGPRIVRWAFGATCLGWLSVAVWAVARRGPTQWRARAGQSLAAGGQRLCAALAAIPRRRWLGAVGLAGLFLGAGFGWNAWSHYRQAVGPIRIRFVLPLGCINRQQPLLVTGTPHAGTFVYAVFLDPEHIKVGFDVWSVAAAETAPIKVDYYAEHELVVDSGSLYPPGHPALRDLSSAELKRLRNHLRIELDGRLLVDREINPFDSRVRDVTVGRNLIGGSTCEPLFAGQILEVQRLPLPAPAR